MFTLFVYFTYYMVAVMCSGPLYLLGEVEFITEDFFSLSITALPIQTMVYLQCSVVNNSVEELQDYIV